LLIAATARHRAIADRVIPILELLPAHRRVIIPKTLALSQFATIVVIVMPGGSIVQRRGRAPVKRVINIRMAWLLMT
jgi:hypothetical protein